MGIQRSVFASIDVFGARPDDQVAMLAHDLANTLQDTRLALAQLRVFLRQREAGDAACPSGALLNLVGNVITSAAQPATMAAGVA